MRPYEGELIVDSCSWIEYLRGTRVGSRVALYLASASNITLNIALAEVACKLFESASKQGEVEEAIEEAEATLRKVQLLSEIRGFNADQAVRAGRLRSEFTGRKRQVSYADCIQMIVARDDGARVISKDHVFREVPEGIFVGE